MARKKKKGKKKQDKVQTTAEHQCLNSHVTEELEALEAIFGDLYSILSDGMGCKVSYVLPLSVSCLCVAVPCTESHLKLSHSHTCCADASHFQEDLTRTTSLSAWKPGVPLASSLACYETLSIFTSWTGKPTLLLEGL